MKKYVIISSDHYPKYHSRAGEETGFTNAIISQRKKHTCRENFMFWKKRVDEVNKHNGYLSIRSWSGVPYKSKQDEYVRFVKLGIESFAIINKEIYVGSRKLSTQEMIDFAYNDGFDKSLSGLNDLLKWMKADKKDIKLGCIIHYTDFRYNIDTN